MKEQEGRSVGIDLAKRSYVARIEPEGEGNATLVSGKTDGPGIGKLCKHLRSSDRVAIECCALGFWLARRIMDIVGCPVYVLNAGKLAIIYKSTKKTDLEDAAKLAWILHRLPPEELPVVPFPSGEEEERRAIVSELHSKKRARTMLVNRLHSLFIRVGQTGIEKRHLKTAKDREETVQSLSGRTSIEAQRILEELAVVEKHIEGIEAEVARSLDGDEKAELLLTMPGVGLSTAMAFLAYVGDGSRFSNAHQVSNFVGMTPRVYASGETTRMGGITKRGCTAIRTVLIQAAWAAVHARENPFKRKYMDLVDKKGKKRAIVAVARRMLEVMWILVTRNEKYRGWGELEQRLKLLRIQKIQQAARKERSVA